MGTRLATLDSLSPTDGDSREADSSDCRVSQGLNVLCPQNLQEFRLSNHRNSSLQKLVALCP
jgi:hypothetical protein